MAISTFETNYMDCLSSIDLNGTYGKKGLGSGFYRTKRLPHVSLSIDCANETPLLKSRRVDWEGQRFSVELGYKVISEWIPSKLLGQGAAEFPGTIGRIPSIGSTWSIVDEKLNATILVHQRNMVRDAVEDIVVGFMLLQTLASSFSVKPGILTYGVESAYMASKDDYFTTLKQRYDYLLSIADMRNKGYEVNTLDEYIKLAKELVSAANTTTDSIEERFEDTRAPFQSCKGVVAEFQPVLDFLQSPENESVDIIDIMDTDPIVEDVKGLTDKNHKFRIRQYHPMPEIENYGFWCERW